MKMIELFDKLGWNKRDVPDIRFLRISVLFRQYLEIVTNIEYFLLKGY